jgi:hypothetical protein
MITGNIKSQIDQIWNAFWSGGISNPLEVIEQITYLLFLRRLDDLHTLEENKSARLKKPMERRVFPEGNDGIGRAGGRAYADLRWSRFKHFAPGDMYTVLGEHAFPFLRTLGGDDSTYAHHVIPKSLLKAQGYETGEINEIANMAFITGQTNRRISNKEATGYLADIVAKQGEGALTSQCVPTDPALWATDRYREFLQLRRCELAKRMNAFIQEKAGL